MGTRLVLYFQGMATLATEIEARALPFPRPITPRSTPVARVPHPPCSLHFISSLPLERLTVATPSPPPLSWKGSQAAPLLGQIIMILISAGLDGYIQAHIASLDWLPKKPLSFRKLTA